MYNQIKKTMKSNEYEVVNVALEINRLLSDGIEIYPDSPIHRRLLDSLIKYANDLSSNPSESQKLISEFISQLEQLKKLVKKV